MKAVRQSDLHVGDILLYRPVDTLANAVSWMIRWVDGADVSHAGLYLGDGEVGEALIVGNSGVNVNPLPESVTGCEWVAVRRLPPADMSFGPILSTARRYLDQGNRYAFNQVLVLAIVCLIRKVDFGNPLVRRVVKRALQEASEFLRRIQDDGKEPMICSEFVFRCYDEADLADDDPFSLEILSQVIASPVRRFSLRRRLMRSGNTVQTDLPPNVHPESLLSRLSREPNKLPSQVTRLQASRTIDESQSLEELIEEYRSGERGSTAELRAASGIDVTDEELAEAAVQFAADLEDAIHANNVAQSAKYESLDIGADTAIDTLAAVVADFVTPGDLLKSPSLRTIGLLEI